MAPTPTYCEDIVTNNNNDNNNVIEKYDRRLEFPFEIVDVEENVNQEMLSYFTGKCSRNLLPCCVLNSNNRILHPFYLEELF